MSSAKAKKRRHGGRANDGNSVSDEELAMLKNQLFQAISEIFLFLQHATDLGIHQGIPKWKKDFMFSRLERELYAQYEARPREELAAKFSGLIEQLKEWYLQVI
jgi:hypothetical protein